MKSFLAVYRTAFALCLLFVDSFCYKEWRASDAGSIGRGEESKLTSEKSCPPVISCYQPLQDDPKYRCGSDEMCNEEYKCCKSGCFIHKVCVIAVDREGNEIPRLSPPLPSKKKLLPTEQNDGDVQMIPSKTARKEIVGFKNAINEAEDIKYFSSKLLDALTTTAKTTKTTQHSPLAGVTFQPSTISPIKEYIEPPPFNLFLHNELSKNVTSAPFTTFGTTSLIVPFEETKNASQVLLETTSASYYTTTVHSSHLTTSDTREVTSTKPDDTVLKKLANNSDDYIDIDDDEFVTNKSVLVQQVSVPSTVVVQKVLVPPESDEFSSGSGDDAEGSGDRDDEVVLTTVGVVKTLSKSNENSFEDNDGSGSDEEDGSSLGSGDRYFGKETDFPIKIDIPLRQQFVGDQKMGRDIVKENERYPSPKNVLDMLKEVPDTDYNEYEY